MGGVGWLFALLAQSFFQLDDFTGQVVYKPTFGNYVRLFGEVNLSIIGRTLAMATIVTIISGIIAFPLAYYMARYAAAGPRRCSMSPSCCRCGRTTWCGSIPGS